MGVLSKIRSTVLLGCLYSSVVYTGYCTEINPGGSTSTGQSTLPLMVDQLEGTTWCIHLARNNEPDKLAIQIVQLKFVPRASIADDSAIFDGVLRFQVAPWAIDAFRETLASDELSTNVQEVRWEGTKAEPVVFSSIAWPNNNSGIALMLLNALLTPTPLVKMNVPSGSGTLDIPASRPRNGMSANGTTAFELSTNGKLVHEKGKAVRWEMTQALTLAYNTYVLPAAGTMFREWTIDAVSGKMTDMHVTLGTQAVEGFVLRIVPCK